MQPRAVRTFMKASFLALTSVFIFYNIFAYHVYYTFGDKIKPNFMVMFLKFLIRQGYSAMESDVLPKGSFRFGSFSISTFTDELWRRNVGCGCRSARLQSQTLPRISHFSIYRLVRSSSLSFASWTNRNECKGNLTATRNFLTLIWFLIFMSLTQKNFCSRWRNGESNTKAWIASLILLYGNICRTALVTILRGTWDEASYYLDDEKSPNTAARLRLISSFLWILTTIGIAFFAPSIDYVIPLTGVCLLQFQFIFPGTYSKMVFVFTLISG